VADAARLAIGLALPLSFVVWAQNSEKNPSSKSPAAGPAEKGISQLARSIPEVLGPTAPGTQKPATTNAAANPTLANAGGLISEVTTLYDYMDIQIEAPDSEGRIQFADTGLELLVRYPVEIRKAPDIDEEMTRKVLQIIETDETVKKAVSGARRFAQRSKAKSMRQVV
jgi:hypothetical protein